MEILHRANTVEMVRAAVPEWRRFEIDIQALANGTLVVYHDEVEDELPADVPTFEQFLQGVPEDGVHIVVETKVYKHLPDVDEILRLCAARSGMSYTFSTFHKPTYETFLEKAPSKPDVWLLVCDLKDYSPADPRICIDQKLLESIELTNHLEVYVYDVNVRELARFREEYPAVSGWILDT